MLTNITAHTVKVTKKEAQTASVALTRRGAAQAYATLEGSEASVSAHDNVRVTRGSHNRKVTEKYAEFRKEKAAAAKAARPAQATAVKAPPEPPCTAAAKRHAKRDEKKAELSQSSKYDRQTGLENAQLLALCKQQSSSPKKAAPGHEHTSPGGPLGEKHSTANSSPDKADPNEGQIAAELALILQKSSERLSKSKQLAQNALKLTAQRSSVALLPNCLMPKRIMSKSKQNKKAEEPAQAQPVQQAT